MKDLSKNEVKNSLAEPQILPGLTAMEKLKISFFAVIPRHWTQLRARHFVIYFCALLIATEGPGIYIFRYSLSVKEVIAASIVALLCGLVLIFTILDELDRNDPLNGVLKTHADEDARE